MAWAGTWGGAAWRGSWDGQATGGGPTYLDAALQAQGLGLATLAAQRALQAVLWVQGAGYAHQLAARLRLSCVSIVHSTPRFFFNDTATTEIYTLSLHDALPIPSLRKQ